MPVNTEKTGFRWFLQWMGEFWEADTVITDLGFFCFQDNGEHLYLVHFHLGKENRGIKNFRTLTDDMIRLAKRKGVKRILTEIYKTTPRYKQLLWVDQRWGGFKIIDELEDHFLLELKV